MNIPYMNPAQLAQAKRLVRAECANYDPEHNECFALDEGGGCACVQSASCSLLCKWFQNCVLPLDEKLLLELMAPARTRKCLICGRQFIPKSNRAVFCSECAKAQIRSKARERMRRRRESKRKDHQIE